MSDLFNRETRAKIAAVPEELPPLREGYVRLIHQTMLDCGESLAENGLIYNRECAHRTEGFSNYADVAFMTYAYTENGFWDRLTHEEEARGNVIAIFDMPLEEYNAHQHYQTVPYLNGTISRGYLVGIIPNYGTTDGTTIKKLSVAEMEEKKQKSKSNPFPPDYETPNWRQDVENAWEKHRKYWADYYEKIQDPSYDDGIDMDFGEDSSEPLDRKLDFGPRIEYVRDETTGEFMYENPEFQKKAEQRRKNKSENTDYLEYKLQCIKEELSHKNFKEDMGKTGDSQTGEVSAKHKKIAEISMIKFKNICKGENRR